MLAENKKINIEISTNTIFKVLLICAVLVLLYLIREVVAIFFFVLLLVSILEPIVASLTARKIPKILAVIIVYVIVLAVFALIIVLLIPPIADQIEQLSQNFPVYLERATSDFYRVTNYINQNNIAQSITGYLQAFQFQLPQTSADIFSKVSDFIFDIFSIFIILIITFYFLVEENATKRILRSLLPSHYLPYTYQLVNRIQQKLGLWLRAQLILGFIIFILVYVALLSLQVKYALILAIVAGLLEFIPYIGPIFSGSLATFLTLMHSPTQALLVVILYILIQSFENHILVPQIMRKAVGLNPVISIFALLVGGKLGGAKGVILAIPLLTVLSVIFEDFFARKKEEEFKLEE